MSAGGDPFPDTARPACVTGDGSCAFSAPLLANSLWSHAEWFCRRHSASLKSLHGTMDPDGWWDTWLFYEGWSADWSFILTAQPFQRLDCSLPLQLNFPDYSVHTCLGNSDTICNQSRDNFSAWQTVLMVSPNGRLRFRTSLRRHFPQRKTKTNEIQSLSSQILIFGQWIRRLAHATGERVKVGHCFHLVAPGSVAFETSLTARILFVRKKTWTNDCNVQCAPANLCIAPFCQVVQCSLLMCIAHWLRGKHSKKFATRSRPETSHISPFSFGRIAILITPINRENSPPSLWQVEMARPARRTINKPSMRLFSTSCCRMRRIKSVRTAGLGIPVGYVREKVLSYLLVCFLIWRSKQKEVQTCFVARSLIVILTFTWLTDFNPSCSVLFSPLSNL